MSKLVNVQIDIDLEIMRKKYNESLSRSKECLSKINIDQTKSNGEIKNFDEIIYDIIEKWDIIDENEYGIDFKNNIIDSIVGIEYSNKCKILINSIIEEIKINNNVIILSNINSDNIYKTEFFNFRVRSYNLSNMYNFLKNNAELIKTVKCIDRNRNKNKDIKELLKSNKDIIKSKEFLIFYYWATNLSLKILSEVLDSNDLTKDENFKSIIENELEIKCKCSKCESEVVIRNISSRANRNVIIENQQHLCENCIIEQEKERVEKELYLSKIKTKIAKFEEISSSIIIKKDNDSYFIKLENESVLSKLSSKYIDFINQMLKINYDNNIDSIEKNNMFKSLICNKEISHIINTSLFINIYVWFTDLSTCNLLKIIDKNIIDAVTKDKLIIIKKDIKTNKEIYRYPRNCNHRDWLYDFYENGNISFEYLFMNKKFQTTINNINPINYIKTVYATEEKSQEEIYRLKTMPYDEYLQTDHWIDTRNKARKRANYKCEICNSSKSLNVHHKTYINRGCEKPEDLICLCGECHSKFHDKLYIKNDSEKVKEEGVNVDSNSFNLGNLVNLIIDSKEAKIKSKANQQTLITNILLQIKNSIDNAISNGECDTSIDINIKNIEISKLIHNVLESKGYSILLNSNNITSISW